MQSSVILASPLKGFDTVTVNSSDLTRGLNQFLHHSLLCSKLIPSYLLPWVSNSYYEYCPYKYTRSTGFTLLQEPGKIVDCVLLSFHS